jgi:hypothetical protein
VNLGGDDIPDVSQRLGFDDCDEIERPGHHVNSAYPLYSLQGCLAGNPCHLDG